MKKVWIAIVILLAVLAALLGFYRYLKNASQSRREAAVTSASEPTVEQAPAVELKAEKVFTETDKEIIHHDLDAHDAPIPQTIDEPSGEGPAFEDLPKTTQEEYLAGREVRVNKRLAARAGVSLEEWNNLSGKEKKILLRKGSR